MMNNRTLRHFISAAALALSLTACVSFGAKAPPQLLVLTATHSVLGGTAQNGAQKDALIVLAPETPRTIDTNRVPVQINNSSVAYLKDAVWTDKPASMMQSLLMETIAAKHGRLVLNEVDAGGKATQFLTGSLLEFGVDASSNEAVVVYDAVMLVQGQVVRKQRFEAREPVAAVEAAPVGVALNSAANAVAGQIADWVGK